MTVYGVPPGEAGITAGVSLNIGTMSFVVSLGPFSSSALSTVVKSPLSSSLTTSSSLFLSQTKVKKVQLF